MFDLRSIKVIVFGALAMLLVFTMPSFSSATFTSSSTTTVAVTSGTWGPEVTLRYAPSPQIAGNQNVTARASDEFGTGVTKVDIEVRRVGATSWTTVCATSNRAPVQDEKDYTCVWKTGDRTNDSYEVRAVATTDAKTQPAESQIVTTNVANGPLTLNHPGQSITGSPRMTGSLSRVFPALTIRLQYVPVEQRDNENAWKTACTNILAYSLDCRWNTTGLNGQYDLRITTTTLLWGPPDHVIRNISIGNAAQSRSILAQGSIGTGPSVNSAIEKKVKTEPVVKQPGADAYETDVEPDPAGSPLEDELKDKAVVEPVPEEPPVVVEDTEDAAAPADDEDETALGDDEEQVVPDDEEDVVEEAELRGVGIDVTDGGNGVGSLDEGDAFTFTYSGEIDLTTVLPGWSGEATAVSVRLRDGHLLGGGAQDDTLDIRSGDLPVELGHVNLGADVIDIDQQIHLSATMGAQTVSVDGALLSTVVVTLGPVIDEDEVLLQSTTAPALTWTPSAAVTTLTGRPCVTGPVTQSAGGTF